MIRFNNFLKQVYVDTLAHELIAGGVEVEPVVLEQERRVEPLGILRIAGHGVEVYHSVEFSAVAYPLIEQLAAFLMVAAAVAVAFERCDRGSEDLDAAGVGIADYVLPYFLDAFGGLDGITRASDVIDSFKENDILDTVVAEEVARVAALPGRAKAAAQHAVAAEAEIQHGDILPVGQKVA